MYMYIPCRLTMKRVAVTQRLQSMLQQQQSRKQQQQKKLLLYPCQPNHPNDCCCYFSSTTTTTTTTTTAAPSIQNLLHVQDIVQEALKNDEPVVALESTIVAHGMPYPQNLETAKRVEAIVRSKVSLSRTVDYRVL